MRSGLLVVAGFAAWVPAFAAEDSRTANPPAGPTEAESATGTPEEVAPAPPATPPAPQAATPTEGASPGTGPVTTPPVEAKASTSGVASPGKDEASKPQAKQESPAVLPGVLKDEMPEPGYLPGYRTDSSLGMSPFAPRVGGMPGGVTPSYRAPTPSEWTFRWNGFFNTSAQYGINKRPHTGTDQSTTIFHSPPGTIEEYASFVSTNNVPGHWVSMNFHYGNRDVTTNVTLTTWNPSDPTTYYQLGSQSFVNNVYLDYRIPQIVEKLQLSSKVGYFYSTYGSLGQYNLGMYQNPIGAIINGIGGVIVAEYDLAPKVTVVIEEGFMGNRAGHAPGQLSTGNSTYNGLTPANPNYSINPIYPGAYVEHLHAGIVRRGDTTIKAQLHYILNWAQDDRPQLNTTNQVWRYVDSANVPDANLKVYTAELNISHGAYGTLAIAASHIDAKNGVLLRGVQTFAGEGQYIADRWLGAETTGTGTINVVGFNYSGSLGRIIAHPRPFDANSPDILVNAGAILANSHSGNPLYDGRVRYKAGLDLYYVFSAYLGAAIRVDRVAPNSKDSGETFHVIAPRLTFKTNWMSRENISLMYAKWFYGATSHMEASAVLPPRLDDQLIALNCNIWW
jgi:hypothetical protein